MRKPIALAIAVIATLALAACGTTHDTSKDGTDCVNLSNIVSQCAIIMTDTRRVTCLAYLANGGAGIDCDWDHADGADNL